MKSSSRRPAHPAFTLIEFMAVITITVILAALVVVGIGYASQKQASERARLQLARLATGLEAYKQDMGAYPVSTTTTDGLGQSAKCLYHALFHDGDEYASYATPPANWTKATSIYVPELDPTSSKQGWVTPVAGAGAVPPASTIVMDPWGNEYRYRSAKNDGSPDAAAINPEFDLWSAGKDASSAPGTPDSPSNHDDLRNFSPPSLAVPARQPIASVVTP
ncbi:MAG: hypothetical protein EOP87_18680 [Verrucomicrobiaceae bacterium]|nr:MAG: hypothetical protein EOP87_18680 [Verrucomicrobiaceae bacterium]